MDIQRHISFLLNGIPNGNKLPNRKDAQPPVIYYRSTLIGANKVSLPKNKITAGICLPATAVQRTDCGTHRNALPERPI